MGSVKHKMVLLALVTCACAPDRDQEPAAPLLVEKGREQALYDDEQLVRRFYDADGDRRADVIAFYGPGGRLVSREVDSNRDGLVDRWETFDLSGRLSRVGLSRRGKPRPDLWISYDDRGQESRREYDDDDDGRPERAEVIALGRVVAEELKTRGDGHFDRRLVLGPDRRVVRVETDADGDGLFERSLPVK